MIEMGKSNTTLMWGYKKGEDIIMKGKEEKGLQVVIQDI